MHGKYESFRGTRIAGVVTMVVGGGAGLIYALSYKPRATQTCGPASSSSFDSCNPSDDMSDMEQHLLVGLGVSLGSILIGGILALKHDEASVRVTPGLAPPRGGLGVSDRRSADLLGAQGLTLSASF